MEEILASIRRIISDDQTTAPPPTEKVEDVLELTQMVQDDGTIVDLTEIAPEPAAPLPAPAPPEVPPMPEETPPTPPPILIETTPLMSEPAATAAVSALSTLATTVEIERLAATPHSNTGLGNGSRTLEDMTLELLRPLLKQWLDQNLPPLVERIVQKEVERISRRA